MSNFNVSINSCLILTCGLLFGNSFFKQMWPSLVSSIFFVVCWTFLPDYLAQLKKQPIPPAPPGFWTSLWNSIKPNFSQVTTQLTVHLLLGGLHLLFPAKPAIYTVIYYGVFLFSGSSSSGTASSGTSSSAPSISFQELP